jgi:hypothetical protein
MCSFKFDEITNNTLAHSVILSNNLRNFIVVDNIAVDNIVVDNIEVDNINIDSNLIHIAHITLFISDEFNSQFKTHCFVNLDLIDLKIKNKEFKFDYGFDDFIKDDIVKIPLIIAYALIEIIRKYYKSNKVIFKNNYTADCSTDIYLKLI